MDITRATPLLGGLAPQVFMRRHWQKKPLLVRQAVPRGAALPTRAQLFALAQHERVESRLIVRDDGMAGRGDPWTLRHGPFPRRALPPLNQRCWTLLVQGLDLHVPAARALLERFRFVPDARLDDLMLSYATDGGGVGPHVDSYDVFLLQAQGRRRWRIGRVRDPGLVPNVPLKILAHFEPESEWLLEAGDLLYLPPGWAHDGVAEGECLTCSIGFRAEGRDELARELLQRLIDAAADEEPGPLYRDPTQAASTEPGRIPPALADFAAGAVTRAWTRLIAEPHALARALGEVLSEPKHGVWFDSSTVGFSTREAADGSGGITVDPRTRAMYDDRHVFVNGEAFRAGGRDARLMRRMADRRALSAAEVGQLSREARRLLADWLAAGWLHDEPASAASRHG